MTRNSTSGSNRWVLTGEALRQELAASGLNRRDLMRRGAVLGAALPLAAAGLSGAVSAAPVRQDATPEATGNPKGGSGTLIVSNAGDPQSFNPNFQVDDSGFAAFCNIFSMLITLDGDYNLLPELAESWEVSEDGLVVTFNLVDNAVWHDGEPVTSADVKYSFEQIINSDSAPSAARLSPIESIDTPDDATVILNLKAPSASLLGFIGWYGTFIMPAHIYEGTDWTTNEANQAPIGSGPFKFVSYTPGSTIELEANLEYFDEGPYLDKLIFQIIPDANTAYQALQNGEIDLQYSPSVPVSQIGSVSSTPGLVLGEQTFPSVHYLGFNFDREITGKHEVRLAIAQAINREQIVETALGGYSSPATNFYTAVIAWASNSSPDAQVPAMDVDAANAALDAAGYPLDGDSRFTLTLPFFTASPEYGDIAAVIKEQLRVVGINIELVALEIGAWEDRMRSGDYDLGLLNGFQGPDPANLASRIGTDAPLNLWFYSNEEIDTLLAEGDTLSDQAERAEKYFAVQQIMAQDLPILPLTNVIGYYPYSDRVSGLYFGDGRGVAGLNRFTVTKLAS